MRLLAAALATLLCIPIATAADAPPPMPGQEVPVTPAPTVAYYVGENGQPVGPLTLEQVQQRVREGKTKRDDLVWKSGLPAWAAAETLAELKPSFQDVVPPLPPEANFKQIMIGTWEVSQEMQGYLTTSRVAYTAEGRYSGYVIMTLQGSQPMQAPLIGTWTVQPAAADTFVLTLKDQNGVESKATLRIVDPNTLDNLGTGARVRKVGP